MNIKDRRFERKKVDTSDTNLLRIGVIFLSLVSFFTTANGMKEYIFTKDPAVAYAASAAIQGILLALSMNLPGYLFGIMNKSKSRQEKKEAEKEEENRLVIVWHFLPKLFLCICALVLTVVTLFCSSWFSYVYIADVIHKDSWGMDSELLVQQTYRTQLYDARDYAHTYRIYLEESVGEKILLLEEQARQLSDSEVDLSVDWERERNDYVSGQATTASSYMAIIIDAMEKAFKDETQESRDLAATAIADAKANIASRRESIQQNLDNLNINITNYNDQIANLTTRINRATADTDIASLNNSINRYTQLINDMTQQQNALQTETMQLDNALSRLPFYESQLGLASSTSAISIRRNLMQLQSEFFQQEPDEEAMLKIATDIFDSLRSASQTTSEETESYTNLLLQMNRLIQNLTDYSEIKDIELNLERLITQLRTIYGGEESEEENASTEESSKTGDTSTEESDDQWKSEWGNRLAELKAQIGSLPVYGETEESDNRIVNVLSEDRVAILRNYDRDSAGKELDDMIRRYISKHNEIYQGIIYLQSPYKSLAIFALILALAFDLSGFIFGVIIQGDKPQVQNLDTSDETPNNQSSLGTPYIDVEGNGNENVKAKWNICKTLKPYIVLTGDYENRDGNYYYKTFKDGVLYYWSVRDISPYPQGIYIQEKMNNGWWRGIPLSEQGQDLFFAHQLNGPSDGVYRDCQLSYVEGSLILEREEQKEFITTIDEYVPVHSYSPNRGENQTIPAKKLTAKRIDVEIAVIALNEKGTRVVAIYMIEK